MEPLQIMPDNETYLDQMKDELLLLLQNGKEAHVFKIGGMLQEVRDRLPEGGFSSWITKNLSMSTTIGSTYLKVYNRFKDEQSRLSHLSLHVLYGLAAEDVPEEFIEEVKEKQLLPTAGQIQKLRGKPYLLKMDQEVVLPPPSISEIARQMEALQEQVNAMQIRELYTLPPEVSQELESLRAKNIQLVARVEDLEGQLERMDEEKEKALANPTWLEDFMKLTECVSKFKDAYDHVIEESASKLIRQFPGEE